MPLLQKANMSMLAYYTLNSAQPSFIDSFIVTKSKNLTSMLPFNKLLSCSAFTLQTYTLVSLIVHLAPNYYLTTYSIFASEERCGMSSN